MDTQGQAAQNPKIARVIKKYPNRRLYDTRGSCYITLADAKNLIMSGETFQVIDARTSEDLTRSVLLQIITEEDTNASPFFSVEFLFQIIRLHGQAIQGMVGACIEQTFAALVDMQDQFRRQAGRFYGKSEGGEVVPAVSTELFSSLFMPLLPLLLQTTMADCVEQTGKFFLQMQEKMQSDAGELFRQFPAQFVEKFYQSAETASRQSPSVEGDDT